MQYSVREFSSSTEYCPTIAGVLLFVLRIAPLRRTASRRRVVIHCPFSGYGLTKPVERQLSVK
ncbi:hypothetical protein NC997_18865 [Trichocoleus sp. DQ-A2]|uniref:hypothetical protein n=1 Tax=Cyanophyceae TaxID=3028117 RepID=UPI00168377B0|nr:MULTISPECIES: hypothetical protein [unclassified Coleofasciculus]MBD1891093.1 hypothetical protein [Coleofasciculus sp. FACHB-SPT9]